MSIVKEKERETTKWEINKIESVSGLMSLPPLVNIIAPPEDTWSDHYWCSDELTGGNWVNGWLRIWLVQGRWEQGGFVWVDSETRCYCGARSWLGRKFSTCAAVVVTQLMHAGLFINTFLPVCVLFLYFSVMWPI